MKSKRFVNNPGGEFINPKTRKVFTPNHKPEDIVEGPKYLRNPVEWQEWGQPMSARLFVGLAAHRATPFTSIGQAINPQILREAVRGMRVPQEGVGVKYGSSFIMQKGHWQDPETGLIDEEDSMQIIIYPGETEDFDLLKKNIDALADYIATNFGQKSIIVEFQRPTDKETPETFIGEYVWKEDKAE